MTPYRDGASRIALAVAIAAAVLAADNTPAAVDLRDYSSATLSLHVGVGGITFTGTNKIDFILTHSDDDVTYTAVTSDDIVTDSYAPTTITNGIIRSLTAAHAAATVQKVGYIGGKRYVKLLADFSGTHGTGTPIAASWIKSHGALEGVA